MNVIHGLLWFVMVVITLLKTHKVVQIVVINTLMWFLANTNVLKIKNHGIGGRALILAFNLKEQTCIYQHFNETMAKYI